MKTQTLKLPQDNVGKGKMMENPAIKRVRKAFAKEGPSENAASFKGVISKTTYFMILTLVGIIGYFVLNGIFVKLAGGYIIEQTAEDGVFMFQLTSMGAIVLVGVSAATVITMILCIVARATIPVTGSIYFLCEGYVLAFLNDSLTPDCKWIGILALLLTVALVVVLLFIHAKGIIKLGAKVRKVIFATFLTVILGGLGLAIMHFIPGLSNLAIAISTIMANPVVSVVFSVIFILIACLFLLADFEAVAELVEAGADKKYEWGCAFGIAYTVLYLYLKIFELLAKAKKK